MKEFMLQAENQDIPFVGAGYIFWNEYYHPFQHGGYGTFINKAAIHRMTQPIFCDGRGWSEIMDTICSRLREDHVGELQVFQQGDSVFDIFFKFSALKEFCMHSDLLIGYMLHYYSGGELTSMIDTPWEDLKSCSVGSPICHNQTPEAMKKFTLCHK